MSYTSSMMRHAARCLILQQADALWSTSVWFNKTCARTEDKHLSPGKLPPWICQLNFNPLITIIRRRRLMSHHDNFISGNMTVPCDMQRTRAHSEVLSDVIVKMASSPDPEGQKTPSAFCAKSAAVFLHKITVQRKRALSRKMTSCIMTAWGGGGVWSGVVELHFCLLTHTIPLWGGMDQIRAIYLHLAPKCLCRFDPNLQNNGTCNQRTTTSPQRTKCQMPQQLRMFTRAKSLVVSETSQLGISTFRCLSLKEMP